MSRPSRVQAGGFRPRAALLATLLALAACAPGLRVIELEPGFTGERTARMRGNVLDGAIRLSPQVEFNLERVTMPEEPARFNIVIEYLGSDWIRIREGETLLLTIDGEQVPLTGEGSERHRRAAEGQFAYEAAWYPIEAELAARIAQAASASIVLRGAAAPVRRTFSARNLENVRGFLQRYPG